MNEILNQGILAELALPLVGKSIPIRIIRTDFCSSLQTCGTQTSPSLRLRVGILIVAKVMGGVGGVCINHTSNTGKGTPIGCLPHPIDRPVAKSVSVLIQLGVVLGWISLLDNGTCGNQPRRARCLLDREDGTKKTKVERVHPKISQPIWLKFIGYFPVSLTLLLVLYC